jgi:hypothetical protein
MNASHDSPQLGQPPAIATVAVWSARTRGHSARPLAVLVRKLRDRCVRGSGRGQGIAAGGQRLSPARVGSANSINEARLAGGY